MTNPFAIEVYYLSVRYLNKKFLQANRRHCFAEELWQHGLKPKLGIHFAMSKHQSEIGTNLSFPLIRLQALLFTNSLYQEFSNNSPLAFRCI